MNAKISVRIYRFFNCAQFLLTERFPQLLSDETKDLIDSATNDFLVRADWNANMACVDKVNALRSATV